LGFRPKQLDRTVDYGDGQHLNQLSALARAGYVSDNASMRKNGRALAHASDPAISLEYRVRSYLDANCAHCHQPNGFGQNTFDARIETPTPLTGLINGIPLNTGLDPGARLIKPGDADRSLVLRRLMTLETACMPPLASHELDSKA
jgi:hypothetical protein